METGKNIYKKDDTFLLKRAIYKYRRNKYLKTFTGAKMVHEAKEFIDILEGEIIKEDIDGLFMEMAYNQELRYSFIMFLRLVFAVKEYDSINHMELTETTNKIFYKLGFEIPGLGKVKKKRKFYFF